MSLSKAFKKNEVKSVAKSKSDFNYDGKHGFYRFYKRYDEFKEMSLGSKYNKMKEFNKLLIGFKILKTKKKTETQLKKERNMKNVDDLYKNYYNAYKSDFGTYYDELTEDKKKKINHKQFVLDDIVSTKSDKLKLPKWVKVSEKRFNEILNTITEAKNNGLKTNVDGEEITLDKVESLLKGVGSGKIDGHEFKEKYNSIVDDAKKII